HTIERRPEGPRRQAVAQAHPEAQARAPAPAAPVGSAPAPGGVVVAVPVAVDPARVISPVGVVPIGSIPSGAAAGPGGGPSGPDGHARALSARDDAAGSGGETAA